MSEAKQFEVPKASNRLLSTSTPMYVRSPLTPSRIILAVAASCDILNARSFPRVPKMPKAG